MTRYVINNFNIDAKKYMYIASYSLVAKMLVADSTQLTKHSRNFKFS